MENNKKKVYPSQQLVCVLPPIALKTLLWFCGWQTQQNIKIYTHQMSRFLKLTEEEVELAIQTLINAKLIEVKQDDSMYYAKLNEAQFLKYFNVKMEAVRESNGIQMATEVTWKAKQKESNMSVEQLQKMILLLQAELKEKEEVKKMVVNNKSQDDDVDSLPF